MTKSLLIVDDNPENLKLILMILATGGYELVTAADALQALSAIEARMPDLILLDLQLPGMDGLELTRRLRATPATQSIPIVAVTAYAMKGDESKARDAGCDGYLVKPIDKRLLRETVKQYLESSV
ncbi:MAG TPA: response regulator [Polyangiales bacterium]|jgi:CheY-like chemotaxis protein|nr:response regulator [Polyangiales bacterium]